MQVGVEPDIVLFFDCPEEEMVKRVLNRNQVVVALMTLILNISKIYNSLDLS